MRSRRPRLGTATLALLLARIGLGQDPAPAPAGFVWKRIESIQAEFFLLDDEV